MTEGTNGHYLEGGYTRGLKQGLAAPVALIEGLIGMPFRGGAFRAPAMHRLTGMIEAAYEPESGKTFAGNITGMTAWACVTAGLAIPVVLGGMQAMANVDGAKIKEAYRRRGMKW